MRVLMPGGSGHVGQSLRRYLEPKGWTFRILSRHPRSAEEVFWDGRSLGSWAAEIDNCDVLINLAGRSVNCRYTERNLAEMMSSRTESTRVLAEAVALSRNPPKVWLQSSTATIYSHRFDAPNDDIDGEIGYDGNDRSRADGDPKWTASIRIAKAWEKTLADVDLPSTRKVFLRSSMVMSSVDGSVFSVLAKLAHRGLGGPAGDGRQYVSWIHEQDFASAVEFLVSSSLDGPVNVCSPNPLPNREFMSMLRKALGVKAYLPTPTLVLEIGALHMRTETELLLKSRRVVPRRLLDAGFRFCYPDWQGA